MIKGYVAIGMLALAACGDPGLVGNADLASPDLANPDLAPSVPRVHRAEALTCPDTRPAIDCKDVTGGSMCSGDDTCTSGVNGRCAGNGHDPCTCSYDTCT